MIHVGYSGSTSAAKWIDIQNQYKDIRDTKDTVRYRRDTGEIQVRDMGHGRDMGHPKNTRQGRATGILSPDIQNC